MTCREQLKIDNPEYSEKPSIGGCYGCPSSYGYPVKRLCQNKATSICDRLCRDCWEQEIPIPSCPVVQGENQKLTDSNENDLYFDY